MGSKITTPGQIQSNNKHHTQGTALRNPTITSPRQTKARCQLKPKPNTRMILKIGMTKPTWRIKGLDNISNKKVNIGINNTRKNLLNIKRSGIPSFNRAATTTSTKDGLRNPRPKPILQLTRPGRSSNTINHRKNTKG